MNRNLARLAVLAACLCLPVAAGAQGCNSDKRPVPGTLAAANDPCPQPKAAPNRETSQKNDKKKERPGTFTSGGTTFYIGGSLGTDVGIRGR